MTIISQEAMEKALQQNFDNEDRDALEASQYAAVKEYLKTVLAEQVFKAPSDLSGSMKEHWARQTPEYKQHLKAIQEESKYYDMSLNLDKCVNLIKIIVY